MSLKFFHILFITVSTVLAFGFAAWELRRYFQGAGGGADLLMGLASLAAGIGLVIYGKYVFNKLRKIS